MDASRARYLLSSAGRAALAAAGQVSANVAPVHLANDLRRRLGPFEASAVAEQLVLRARARDRFGDDRGWLYTPDGLEMMTEPRVAAWRAARLGALGLPVADLTVGLGGDAAALVERGATVIGLDRDPITARLAAHNVPGAGIVVADARRPPFDLSGFAALVDPPRRAGGRREREVPGLAFGDALAIAAEARAAAVKAAASTRRDEAGPSAELTYVQLGRTMRECCMWVGAGATTGLAAALLLPSGTSLDSTAPESAAVSPRVGDVLYDPQPCVTLAGLVTHLAAALGAWRLDPMVGYLSADAAGGHPLATAFEVMEVMPFSLKRLRTVLRTNGWKPGEIRRRAFPVEPDDLRRMLGKLDGEPVTLLLTTIGSSRTAVVARPLSPAESS